LSQRYAVIEERPNPKIEHGRDDWFVWETTRELAGEDFIRPYPGEMSYEEVAKSLQSFLEDRTYQIETREDSERRLAKRKLGDQNPEQLEFSLEIERDPSKEIALPPRDIVDLRAVLNQKRDDAHADKDGTSQAKLSVSDIRESEEEKKRRQDLSDTSKDAELNVDRRDQKTAVVAEEKEQVTEPEEPRSDRTFPDDIQRAFYIRADHRGDQHVYADSNGKREVFQDSGEKLRTKSNNAHAVKLMLDTAAHRGWSSINVKGSAEFKREAWLEGQARGIAVSGYKPTELDLQELKNREQAYLRNEIVPAEDQAIARDRVDGAERLQDKLTSSNANQPSEERDSDQPAVLNEHTQANGRSAAYRDGIKGVLIEQGSRPYKDDEKNDPSPYIVLQDKHGQRHTAWGVGLPDAILKSGAREGDHLRVREAGMETVTKNVLREIDGRTVRLPQEVERRAWEAEVVRQREKDGLNANDARANDFIALGRSAARQHPELKAAASLDAYVERKVRQSFPNDPAVVQSVLQTARAKIGDAVARGDEIPEPRVIELREHHRTTPINSEHAKAIEQNHELSLEKNRQQERSR